MNKHQKLDSILKYMSKNIGEIPKKPDLITGKANLIFDKTESYMMFKMLLDDGYVYEHNETAHYGIKYKGIVFLDNGGYTFQHKVYKRKRLADKISDLVGIVVKPIGVLTAFLVSIWYIIKLLEFFGIINSCVN
tara:strand:+ start:915 stop:1316 length:402 start_codon:yes stop_codon:yes gene_type:complete